MASASTLGLPSKRPVMNKKDMLFNDIIDKLETHNVGWHGSDKETDGSHIVKVMKYMKKKKTTTTTTDRPSLKKAVEGNQTFFFCLTDMLEAILYNMTVCKQLKKTL